MTLAQFIESGEVDQRSPFAEHKFVYNRSAFEIDKKYLGGVSTEYDFKMRDIRSATRFKLAIQWVRDDQTDYEAIVFEMLIPRSERLEENAVLEVRKADSWLFNSHKASLDDYIRQVCVGEHYAMYDPQVHIITQRSSRVGWDDGDGLETYLHLRFRFDGHEPMGANRLWFVYEWYVDEENCIEDYDCITLDKVEGQQESYNYFTTLSFGDFVDRQLLIDAYWFLFAQSLFWIAGMPFGIVVTTVINIYMDYQLIYHLVVAFFATGGWYDDPQNEMYSLFNWFFESVCFWSTGTRMITFLMLYNTSIPILGPVFNLLLVLLMYWTIFN